MLKITAMRACTGLLLALMLLTACGDDMVQRPLDGSGERYTVLFDAAHAQVAGNADWIVSTSMPDPLQQHENPRHERDWTGGYSAWGVALQQSGRYSVMTNTKPFTYGEQKNSLDLSNFDVLIIPEPNIRFSQNEKRALLQFVWDGGGLFMIADHTGSDRNNDGYDSPAIFNDLMNNNSQGHNPFGLRFDLVDIEYENPRNLSPEPEAAPLLNGPFGKVQGSIIRSGTTLTLDPDVNSEATGVIYRNGVSNTGTRGIFVALSSYEQGRVVAIGDSSPGDDGTCAPGNRCHANWHDRSGQNAALLSNATEWLASAA